MIYILQIIVLPIKIPKFHNLSKPSKALKGSYADHRILYTEAHGFFPPQQDLPLMFSLHLFHKWAIRLCRSNRASSSLILLLLTCRWYAGYWCEQCTNYMYKTPLSVSERIFYTCWYTVRTKFLPYPPLSMLWFFRHKWSGADGVASSWTRELNWTDTQQLFLHSES